MDEDERHEEFALPGEAWPGPWCAVCERPLDPYDGCPACGSEVEDEADAA